MKRTLKIVIRIFAGLLLALIVTVSVFVIGSKLTARYNETFPEKYIADTYPNAEILGSGYTGGFMFDAGNLYYECRDTRTGMKFDQTFKKTGMFGRLEPYNELYNGYDARLTEWNAEEENIAAAESCLKAEHFIIHNPLNTSGIVIFAKNEAAENIDALMQTLNASILDRCRNSGLYTDYTIIVCGERLFDVMRSVDFDDIYRGKSGQCDFYDIARAIGLEHERITFKDVSTLDYDVYNAPGDPSDDEYVSPESFDETAVCILGEVNAIGDQSMLVFGVDF